MALPFVAGMAGQGIAAAHFSADPFSDAAPAITASAIWFLAVGLIGWRLGRPFEPKVPAWLFTPVLLSLFVFVALVSYPDATIFWNF